MKRRGLRTAARRCGVAGRSQRRSVEKVKTGHPPSKVKPFLVLHTPESDKISFSLVSLAADIINKSSQSPLLGSPCGF